MFIAHLPAGYILAKFLDKKLKQTKTSKKAFFAIIMIGAVFLILIYFIFIYLITGQFIIISISYIGSRFGFQFS